MINNYNELIKNSISTELKIIRIENGDSQEELSKKSKVATSTICKYENNATQMNLNKIAEIIAPYNISLPIFFERILAKTQE